jgi:hypothetical protein
MICPAYFCAVLQHCFNGRDFTPLKVTERRLYLDVTALVYIISSPRYSDGETEEYKGKTTVKIAETENKIQIGNLSNTSLRVNRSGRSTVNCRNYENGGRMQIWCGNVTPVRNRGNANDVSRFPYARPRSLAEHELTKLARLITLKYHE